MIQIEAEEAEITAASRVASSVSLLNFHLVALQVKNSLVDRPVDPRTDLQVSFEPHFLQQRIIAPRRLLVEVGVKVKFSPLKSEAKSKKVQPSGEDVAASIDLTYGVEYGLPEEQLPDEIKTVGIPAFARLNGLYHCWPYLREEVHKITAAMNVPFILPTLQIISDSEKEEVQGVAKKARPKRQNSRRK